MNTGRFHRTLMSAFPRDHAGWITRHKRPLSERVADALFAVFLGLAAATVLAHWAMS